MMENKNNAYNLLNIQQKKDLYYVKRRNNLFVMFKNKNQE